jgi:hypothetical protein
MQTLEKILNNGEEIGSLLLGISAIFTVLFLVFRGRSWYEAAQVKVTEKMILFQQQEHHRKLKFELALEAIDLFNRYKVDLDIIRSPVVLEGETQNLQQLEETNSLIKNMKRHSDAGVTLMRLDERAETLASLNRLRAKFGAVFGDESPFEDAIAARHKIWVSCIVLADEIPGPVRQEHRGVISKVNDEDEISKYVSLSLEEFELSPIRT